MAKIVGLLGVLAAGLILAGCGGSGADNSQKIVNDIKVNGSTKLVAGSGLTPDVASISQATATVSDATCAQSLNGTQSYTCVVHFSVGSAILQTTAYTGTISATCDDAGACLIALSAFVFRRRLQVLIKGLSEPYREWVLNILNVGVILLVLIGLVIAYAAIAGATGSNPQCVGYSPQC
jgi:hypothetical protein